MLMLATVLHAGGGKVLCIGLNHYDQYPDLKHAESDATRLGQAYARLGHEVEMLTGVQVTRTNVLQALARGPDIVYFAGHAAIGRLLVRDGEIPLASIINARMLMILDCCYVGGGLKTSGTMMILAASEFEAFESGSHGLFTKYLLIWMREGNSHLSEASLTAYLTRHIRKETYGWQKPVLGFL